MPQIFVALDKIKPAYDITYRVVLVLCKILLVADILITSMAVAGRYIPFIPDPSWSEEVVLTLMSYMAVLSAALAIRRGSHIRMTALDGFLPKGLLKFLDILADVAVCILAVIMIAAPMCLCPGCPAFGCTSPCLWPVWPWSFLNWKPSITTSKHSS